MCFSAHGNAIYRCENASVFTLMKPKTYITCRSLKH